MKFSRRASRLAVRYFDDRVLLSDTEAWAYFRLPTFSYEFSTPEGAKLSPPTSRSRSPRSDERRGSAPADRPPHLSGGGMGDPAR